MSVKDVWCDNDQRHWRNAQSIQQLDQNCRNNIVRGVNLLAGLTGVSFAATSRDADGAPV